MAQEGGPQDRADDLRDWQILHEPEPNVQERHDSEAAKAARSESEQAS